MSSQLKTIMKPIWFLLPLCIFSQSTIKQGFADVTYQISDTKGDGGQYAIGQYDHIIMSELSDRITFFNETVFDYDDDWILDVERLWIRYLINEYLNVSVGLFHTPLGFWNREYHHGTLLHTSIDRPVILNFKDDGGLLPIHTTGLMVTGKQIGKFNFAYNLMTGNGFGSNPISDNDNTKSITGYFQINPLPSLNMGLFFLKDKISSGVLKTDHETPIEHDISQLVTGVSFVYQKRNVEIITEYFNAGFK